jgi:O-antigen/teichoic acid export membrane protein
MLSKGDFGIVQQFNLLLTTLVPFIGLTLVSSLYYFYPIEERNKSNIVLQTFILLVFTGLLFQLVFTYNKDFLLGLLQLENFATYPDYLFFSIPLYLISSISDNLFLLEKKNIILLLYLPLEKLLFLVAVLCCYAVWGTLEGIFFGIMIYSIIKTLFVVGYVQQFHRFQQFKPDIAAIYIQLKYCIPFYIANVVYIMSIKFDKFYINKYVSPESYALYSIAFISIPLLSNAFNSINSVAMPEITSLLRTNDTKGVITLYRKMVLKSSALALPCMVFFFLNSREIIIFLFTKNYSGATPYYQIYLLTFLVSLTSYGLILRASNRTRTIFIVNLLSALVTVGCGFWLIPVYQMTGAIITAVLAIVLPGIAQLAVETRIIGTKFTIFFPLRQFFAILLFSSAFSPLIIVVKLIGLPALPTLLVSGIIYFCGTIWLLYRFGLFPFAATLEKVLGKIKHSVIFIRRKRL